jgi:hypothetical protein
MLSSLITACSSSVGASNVKQDFTVDMSNAVDTPISQLQIHIRDNGQPADFSDGKSIVHVHIVPPDVSLLYHAHPQQVKPGEFILDSPVAQTGDYDAWIEITTTGHGHVVAFLKRFLVKLNGTGTTIQTIASDMGVRLESKAIDLQAAGKRSSLEFLILKNAAPVNKFGEFVGVPVHSWAVSLDRTFLVHDHVDVLGKGQIKAEFTFPKPGDYAIFIQPAIPSGDHQDIPMLRYPITVK